MVARQGEAGEWYGGPRRYLCAYGRVQVGCNRTVCCLKLAPGLGARARHAAAWTRWLHYVPCCAVLVDI